MNEVPESNSPSGDGTQAQGSALLPATIAPPMQVDSVPDAIEGLVATHSRNLGGDVAARLLAASMRYTSNQLAAAHQVISERDAESRTAAEEISALRVEVAQLKERLGHVRSSARVKNACTFVGTALLGVAIDLFKSNLNTAAVLTALLGIGLLAVAILPTRGAAA